MVPLDAVRQVSSHSAIANWSYVSGFFDGEGSINVHKKRDANVLGLEVRIVQKSRDVLNLIADFLESEGIHSAIYEPVRGISSLEIIRVNDLQRFLTQVHVIVKHEQVLATQDYLAGTITGDQLLRTFDIEHVMLRRKKGPNAATRQQFPLTRLEAIRLASEKSSKARLQANRRIFLSRLRNRVLALPVTFDVGDIQKSLQISRGRARELARMMEGEHLVTLRYQKVPPRFRKLVGARTI